MSRTLALLILSLSLPAAAGAQSIPPGTLVAGLSGDWNGDGNPDLALLLAGAADEPAADLVLYHGTGRGLEEVLRVPGAAFLGAMWGMTPGLAARSATSFTLTSEQTGIGRSPWAQEVTLAWRGGAWVVAGFTHTFYDRIDNTRTGRCDVNLLSGGWEAVWGPGEGAAERRASGRDGPRAFPLADLPVEYVPQVCAPIFE